MKTAYIYPLFSFDINASPESIHLGGEGSSTTTLSWTSRDADSVHIDPGMGTVSASGSLTISPQQTTTYTITGTRDGATVTDSVIVVVIDPSVLPTVTISATPETIVPGASVILSWSSTNVATVALDSGIGEAPMTGSLSVFPVETTTYTVTATNAAGSATASVTITVTDPLPTVELTVEPEEITAGESADLAWTSTNADIVSIEPGIGAVKPNGTLAVTPMQTTTYTITATGSGGTSTQSATVTVNSPISIQILFPADGASIDRPDVMVHGTFDNTTGSETGIAVNGRVAMVSGNRFVANHVSLEEGANTITVTATDINGYSQTADTTVNAIFPEHYINLVSNIESGSSPLKLTLNINGSFSIDDATLSNTGIDPVELMEIEPDAYQVSLIDEGITYFTAEVIHETLTYTDTIAIMVVDAAEIDALLQQKWGDMKTWLLAKNVEAAIDCFDDYKKSLYEEIFTVLIDRLPQIASDMQDISMISIADKTATYRIRRIETHNTGTYSITYYIYFIMDENGIWKIYRF